MKTKIIVTKEFIFDAAHYLINYDGDCGKMHGHTYRMRVSLSCKKPAEDGMVIDFKEIKRIVEENIISLVDHSVLNETLSNLPTTTAENMIMYFYELLTEKFKELSNELTLESIKLWETPTSYAEIIPRR